MECVAESASGDVRLLSKLGATTAMLRSSKARSRDDSAADQKRCDERFGSLSRAVTAESSARAESIAAIKRYVDDAISARTQIIIAPLSAQLLALSKRIDGAVERVDAVERCEEISRLEIVGAITRRIDEVGTRVGAAAADCASSRQRSSAAVTAVSDVVTQYSRESEERVAVAANALRHDINALREELNRETAATNARLDVLTSRSAAEQRDVVSTLTAASEERRDGERALTAMITAIASELTQSLDAIAEGTLYGE